MSPHIPMRGPSEGLAARLSCASLTNFFRDQRLVSKTHSKEQKRLLETVSKQAGNRMPSQVSQGPFAGGFGRPLSTVPESDVLSKGPDLPQNTLLR